MRRIGVISGLLVLVMLLASPAYAAWPARTHGNFTTSTEGCAGCHTTHAGSAGKLLRYGTNTTTFCKYCHEDNSKTPYDTGIGKSQSAESDNPWVDSPAGGFNSYKLGDITSKHDLGGTAVPGGDTDLTGTFSCGSCHDPHSGTSTIEDGNRLLRGKVNDWPVTKPVFKINPTTKVTTGYVSGFSQWCAGCHNMLAPGTDSGHTPYKTAATGNVDKYRHAMDVTFTEGTNLKAGTKRVSFSQDMLTGTPLEYGTDGVSGTADDKLGCMTCHRAHGTSAAAPGSYSQFNTVKNGTSSGSALLRLDKRGVCFNCHDAAKYNLPD